MNAFAIGGRFEVKSREQFVPDEFHELPHALGRAAAVRLTAVAVDHDEDCRRASIVIGPKVMRLPACKMLKELVITQRSTETAAIVAFDQFAFIQFGTDADTGDS